MALVHAAGQEAVQPEKVNNLAPNAAANMSRWAPDIRALLLQNQFAPHLAFACTTAGRVTVSWKNAAIWSADRPGNATLATQAGLVRNYVDQRADRSAEILSQLGLFGEYFGIILGLSQARNLKTYELLAHVQSLAGYAVMLPKHMMACRRPDEIDLRINPLVPTPGHSAFPSGHATQAFAIATVLAALVRAVPLHFPDRDNRIDLLYRQAHRIAANRTVAGVHFPMDSTAGAKLGMQIGRVLVGLMSGSMTPAPEVSYDPNAEATKDFLFDDLKNDLPPVPVAGAMDEDQLFAWSWKQAIAEFAVAPATSPAPGV